MGRRRNGAATPLRQLKTKATGFRRFYYFQPSA
nr:MAG TPA: hypothetical protein [Caudoviricetes sp.]